MRGVQDAQELMFFSIDIESRIRADHPLRPIKQRVDRVLAAMNERFDAAYSQTGRPSVPPEQILKALLLMALYSIRSERQVVERIDTDLLFRWFLGMDPAEPVFDATAFTHNRPRLDEHGLTAAFFDGVLAEAIQAGLCSDDHFSVDGTMIESYASIKSFRPQDEQPSEPEDSSPRSGSPASDNNGFKPRNAEVDFRGQKRSNKTHQSTTDPEARLYRKGNGQESKLAHLGHALTENRHGLIMGVTVTEANGRAEREAALELIDQLKSRQDRQPQTLGADKGYDSGPWYLELEQRGIEPHTAMPDRPRGKPEHIRPRRQQEVAARDRMRDRLTNVAYELSQRCRRKAEECFGWLKTVAGLVRSRWVGRWKLQQQLEISAAAFNLVRLRKLKPL